MWSYLLSTAMHVDRPSEDKMFPYSLLLLSCNADRPAFCFRQCWNYYCCPCDAEDALGNRTLSEGLADSCIDDSWQYHRLRLRSHIQKHIHPPPSTTDYPMTLVFE